MKYGGKIIGNFKLRVTKSNNLVNHVYNFTKSRLQHLEKNMIVSCILCNIPICYYVVFFTLGGHDVYAKSLFFNWPMVPEIKIILFCSIRQSVHSLLCPLFLY